MIHTNYKSSLYPAVHVGVRRDLYPKMQKLDFKVIRNVLII